MELIVAGLALATVLVLGISAAPVGVSVRGGGALVAAALSALVLPVPGAVTAMVTVAVIVVADAITARGRARLDRRVARTLARGVPVPLEVVAAGPRGATVRIRQASTPDLDVEPPEATDRLEATLTPVRRGHHTLPAPAARVDGPLGLVCWHPAPSGDAPVDVFPDLPAARRLARAVKEGTFRDAGLVTLGPLGLGTEFESVREYTPDDDIRQVNWRATMRVGRPMTNQFRVEQDRDVICVLDTGRLMAAPLGDLTRLDAALDALCAVALVADTVGDRCGGLAFDSTIRRDVRPRRRGGDALVRATYDLEPSSDESDYEAAFHAVRSAKRALVLIFTDLLDDVAADALVSAVPVLAARHVVAVATVTDPDIRRVLTQTPQHPRDVYAASVALDVLDARARAVAQLRMTGAAVVEAPPDRLAAECVSTYLRAKSRARL